MKRLIWTAVVTCLVGLGAGEALAQTVQPNATQTTPRGQTRARIERRVDQRFKRLDQNNNGLIEQGEWRRKPRIFQRFDADRDGTLSPAEFRQLARAVMARLALRGS